MIYFLKYGSTPKGSMPETGTSGHKAIKELSESDVPA